MLKRGGMISINIVINVKSNPFDPVNSRSMLAPMMAPIDTKKPAVNSGATVQKKSRHAEQKQQKRDVSQKLCLGEGGRGLGFKS